MDKPDERSIMTYVAKFLEKYPDPDSDFPDVTKVGNSLQLVAVTVCKIHLSSRSCYPFLMLKFFVVFYQITVKTVLNYTE